MKRVIGMGIIFLLSMTQGLLAEEQQTQASSSAPAASTTTIPSSNATQPSAPAVPPEIIWVDDSVPPNAKTEGTWLWDSTTFISGTKSHGHPSGKGIQSHSFTADPVSVSANGMFVQQVWLDPKDPPKGIMLKFKLASGEQVGVYWEGEQEVFNPADNEEVWYYGLLPELGTWASLNVLVEDLGLEDEKVTGLSYVTYDGRALWDKTSLTQAPAIAEENIFPEDLPAPALGQGKQ